uniref:SEC16 homolog B, endoplasmic reticulum export factor n=1 Tax=Sphenodon punctatus TaxID=8508 RepID=A0A8D0H1L9_SPHPU
DTYEESYSLASRDASAPTHHVITRGLGCGSSGDCGRHLALFPFFLPGPGKQEILLSVPPLSVIFPAPSEPSLLLQYKESGLSSSSYELSQYMFDSSDQYDPASSQTWSPIQSALHLVGPGLIVAVLPKMVKYPHPHVPVCFGAGGQLVRVCPNSPAEGQPALVEMHSLEVRYFLSCLPLSCREDLHKVDVMTFCQRRVALSEVETQRGRDSALLWKLLLLLCRQNGAMVGSDTAELLMQDCKRRERYHRQETVANLINLTDESWPVPGGGMPDLLTGEIPPCTETPQHSVEKFTKLLFYGRKKEALDRAMRSQLWGHALFLSSKMDLRTYSWVLSGFTSTLALNDPLQTLFQLMSGRIPQAALCCGDERWGDWRPHLDVILSNQIGDAELNHRAIIAMGDTLAGKGLIEAAHFCYLMANVTLGCYRVRTDRVVLLGSSQETDCIQRTEVFEYCQLLGHPKAFIPAFQMYKLLYASRLADYGLPSQALHYCEGIGITLLAQGQSSYPVLLEQVIKVGLGTSSGLFWLWLGPGGPTTSCNTYGKRGDQGKDGSPMGESSTAEVQPPKTPSPTSPPCVPGGPQVGLEAVLQVTRIQTIDDTEHQTLSGPDQVAAYTH